ncbi:MAG: type II/IV secretion system ATPase subunit [Thermoplasmata archaeon]|nr:type II/IV secretion system ATPase subunit [Thermoplasmatales archaeon]PMP73286.1 MAG: secretion system protein E [Aciduliprofundum sp.]HEU12867.1 secretion system protein E [Euryarchaeota archaeon]
MVETDKLKGEWYLKIIKPLVKKDLEEKSLKVMVPVKQVEEINYRTPIPEVKDPDLRTVEIQKLEEPYSYVRILYNTRYNEYIYEFIEPPLDVREKKLFKSIKNKIVELIDYKEFENKDEKNSYLFDLMASVIEDMDETLGEETITKFKYYLRRDFIGYGPIQIPMLDPEVEDISCDGVNIPIYIYHRKYESIRSTFKFESEEDLDNFVIWIVQKSGRHISIANPMVDASLPDGSRLQATLGKYVTKRGSSFTIRRFKPNPFTPLDLVKFKTLSREMMAYIWLSVENGISMIIAGGTASGKTTTLNATLLFIPPSAKIVSIEDTRELNLPHENWIPALVREGYGEFNPVTGKRAGEIDMFDLLTSALRQRPHYIIVGEVRGKEAYTVFQAMATGKTCYTTFHADDVKSLVHRLENEPINLPRALLTSLDLILLQGQVKVGTKMTRRVKSLTEIVAIDPESGELVTNNAYVWNPADDTFNYSGHSYVYEKISTIKNWSPRRMEIEVKRRELVLEYMEKENVSNYRDVARIVSEYYKDPEGVIERVQEKLKE